MFSIRTALKQLTARVFPPPPPFGHATAADVYYCYRLFLNREPTPKEHDYWTGIVKNHHISIEKLSDAFLYHEELQTIQAERNKLTWVELPDFKIAVQLNDYVIGAVIAEKKQYEPHVTTVLEKLLQPEMTFLDIGANIGFFTCLAAGRVGTAGKIIAFEPVPSNCDLIQQSVAANHFNNVTLYPYAVAEQSHNFALDMEGRNTNSRIVPVQEKGDKALVVEAVALDDFLPALPRLDIVKIDIEGAEPRAIQGMKKHIAQHKPIILFEFSPDLIEITSQQTPASFLDDLQGMGYQLYAIPTPQKEMPANKPLSTAEIISFCQSLTFTDHIDLLAKPLFL